jgi:hypothetical protein
MLLPVVLEQAHTMGHEGNGKCCIGSTPFFTAHMHDVVFVCLCRVVRYVNVTKWCIFIQPVYCNHYPSLVKCEVILLWIS